MNSKVLITGGSGFIGINLIDCLIKNSYTVLNLDIQPPKNKNHLEFWHKADLVDYSAIEKIVLDFNPDYIVHLAARTDLSGKNLTDYNANTTGTENLCKILSGNTLNIKKIIFTSSMLVCKAGYITKTYTDFCPTTFYGESKTIAEEIIWNFWEKLPPWSIMRATSIWGPWFQTPYIDFFHIVLSGRFIFPKSKACTKTYGYVENSCHQILKILLGDIPITNREVFYIGDEPPINIEEWAQEIRLLSKLKKNRQVPFIILKLLALTGDLLNLVKINFPMTSFRLKNMTTDNILPLTNTVKLCGTMPISRNEGTIRTLKWMKSRSAISNTI